MADDLTEWHENPDSQESDQPSQVSEPTDWHANPEAQAAPEEWHPNPNFDLTKAEGDSTLGAAVRAAAHSVIPGALGLVGAGLGAATPVPGGMLAGGLGGAYIGGKIQSTIENALFPEEAEKMAQAEEEHPIATGVGSVAGFLPGLGVQGASTLVRAASGLIGFGADLALTGDVEHAAAVGATSTLLGGPNKLGATLESAGKGVGQKLGGSEEKLSTLIARNMAERTNNAESSLNMDSGKQAIETASQDNVGASTEGAATPPGDTAVPGHPGDGKVAADVEQDSVQTAKNGPGATAARGVAEEKSPPQSNPEDVGDAQNKVTRSNNEYGKDKVAEGGEVTPTDVNTLPEDQVAALKFRAEDEAAAAEPQGQYQQQEQQQKLGGPRSMAPDQGHTVVKVPNQQMWQVLTRSGEQRGVFTDPAKAMEEARRLNGKQPGAQPAPEQPKGDLRTPEAFVKEQQAKEAAERSAIDQATTQAVEDAKAQRRAAAFRQATQGQEAPGAGGVGKPPPGAPPPNVAGPGGKGPAEPVPPPRYAAAEKTTPEKAGEALNRGLDNLNRMQNADFFDFTGKLKKATQSAATLLGKGGEDLYHAIEQGKYKELPEQLRNHWENFSADMKKEIKGLEDELAKRKIKPPETDDPNYISRVRNMPFSWKDWLNNDPVSALRGMVRPDMMKPLEYRGAEAPDGSRIVLQDMSPSKYAVWKDGKSSVYNAGQREEGAKGFKNGDKVEYNGKQYTVDRGRTNEIEQHARDAEGNPIKYKKNAALSLYEHRSQLKAALAYDDMIRTFKGDKALDDYRMKASSPEGQSAIKNQGFEELHGEPYKDFEGIAMHPDLAQAIRNNFQPGFGVRNNPIVNAMRAMNQFAVRSIFWNPVPHSMNSLLHYVVARGEDWLPFKFDKDSYIPKEFSLDNYKRLADSWKQAANVVKGYYDVGSHSGMMQELNQSGVPLVQSAKERSQAHETIGNMLQANLKAEPRLWAGWAQKFGLGKATDAVKAVYDQSSRALWAASDAMMAARVYELEAKGLTREQAIGQATIHMPDYVLPNKLFGVRGLPSTMSDPSVFMFGRYHAKVLDSLAHMAMDAVGKNSTVEERRQAFGNIMAVGIMATVVYPALDAAVKSVTGNENAEVRRRGPLAPLGNVKEAVAPEEGKPARTYASAASNLLTLSPMIRTVKEALLDNRDWRGKAIVEPASPFYKQAGQLAEYLTKTAVSPYGTAEAAASEKGPGVLSSLAQQVTDTKVPTEEQVAGQAKAAKAQQKSSLRREKKPEGFIEKGLGALSL